MARKILSLILCFSFLSCQSGFAQVAGELNISVYIGNPGSGFAVDKFRPLHLRYFSYDPSNNNFRILLDKGDLKDLKGLELESSSRTLLDYFLIGVTLPDKDFWVNLRPDSENNIIEDQLARTDMGKIILEADLQLKKDTARLTSPKTSEGKAYWEKLYQKAGELFGSDNITIPTLTRPWIVPNEVIVRETKDSAYVYKATLKVMLEQDHLKNSTVYNFKDPRLKALNEYSAQIIRETIIPKLTKEVNISKRYASLRQVFYSLILARWFKAKFSGKDGLYSNLIDKGELSGLTSKENWSKTTYFKQYQKSFQEGEYNVQEPAYTPFGQTIRTYFSGGVTFVENAAAAPNAPGGTYAASPITNVEEVVLTRIPGTVGFISNANTGVLREEAGFTLSSPASVSSAITSLAIRENAKILDDRLNDIPHTLSNLGIRELVKAGEQIDTKVFKLAQAVDGFVKVIQDNNRRGISDLRISGSDKDKALSQKIEAKNAVNEAARGISQALSDLGAPSLSVYEKENDPRPQISPLLTILKLTPRLHDVGFAGLEENYALLGRNAEGLGYKINFSSSPLNIQDRIDFLKKNAQPTVDRFNQLVGFASITPADIDTYAKMPYATEVAEIFAKYALPAYFNNRPTEREYNERLRADQIVGTLKGTTAGSPVSSPLSKDVLGGVDFRTMNMIIQPMGSFSHLNLTLPKLSNVDAINLDKEFADIQKMVEKGMVPSGSRIKEFVAACYQKKEIGKRTDDMIACLVTIFRLEEETLVESTPELKEALVILDSNRFVL